MSRVMMK